MNKLKEILIFQHMPHEHPGMIKDVAEKQGVKLNTVELWKPYAIPDEAGYSGLVIMGGPMGVYEGKGQYPSKEDELTFIKR